ncbi:hypothetical protein RB195_020199 [Necator americanus]|uniref:Uncharacterized protein n=1 Tax=Necator americanus TaxID=51031 RepID=A0ABR1CJ55_NECAM
MYQVSVFILSDKCGTNLWTRMDEALGWHRCGFEPSNDRAGTAEGLTDCVTFVPLLDIPYFSVFALLTTPILYYSLLMAGND